MILIPTQITTVYFSDRRMTRKTLWYSCELVLLYYYLHCHRRRDHTILSRSSILSRWISLTAGLMELHSVPLGCWKFPCKGLIEYPLFTISALSAGKTLLLVFKRQAAITKSTFIIAFINISTALHIFYIFVVCYRAYE